jgi:hypothetical protein
VKFCFGSNGRYPAMGQLDYSVQMAKELEALSELGFVEELLGIK